MFFYRDEYLHSRIQWRSRISLKKKTKYSIQILNALLPVYLKTIKKAMERKRGGDLVLSTFHRMSLFYSVFLLFSHSKYNAIFQSDIRRWIMNNVGMHLSLIWKLLPVFTPSFVILTELLIKRIFALIYSTILNLRHTTIETP